MQAAWIVCWSHDETMVKICPDGRDGPQVWCAVQHDRLANRLYCECRGRLYHLQFAD